MQTDNELKDILLDNDDEIKSAKIKRLLVFVAALVILFLIIVMAIKMLNSSDVPQAQNDIDSRLVLPPVPTQTPKDNNIVAQQPSLPINDKKDDQLFEQVPIVPESKSNDEFEDMVKRLKEKESNKIAAANEAKKEELKSEVVVAKEQPKAQSTTSTKTQNETKAADKKQEVKQSQAAKPTQTPVAKTQPTKPTAQASTGGSYVQVFAGLKYNPNADYLKKLQAKGYKYQTVKVGELTKVIVGPFGANELKNALADIRKDVNKDAFVYKAK
ncbi:SPOR domain-containing protein [Campylobacter sp. RM12920]|uniref:SPOR domain-containing protein n=1 Tax=Campylobacter californiensis TaxID=1032243 RepID=A0ABD4JJM4_9BACT|nr:SPOR domain-containing protein [Campylobacter sp. RM12919]MBE2988707.1 SPOR domain-containing protein [Campylobacter sp. RM12920]